MLNPIASNAKDFWTGVIYCVLGGAVLVISQGYEMGTAFKMGPAYFPTILSALLVVIGVISLIRSFLRKGTPVGTIAVKGLPLVIGATVLFGIVVRGAGLVIALPGLVLVSALASKRFQWRYTVALAVGVTVFCILVFRVALGVPLPILGAWFE
jgi:hypothetical protein